VFTWSDPLFEEPPRPGPSGRLAVRGPGFGVDLDEAALGRLGERVAWFGP
jgi:L-alanine-DL-glutamate epimerase-like enolase superfamily enzyme